MTIFEVTDHDTLWEGLSFSQFLFVFHGADGGRLEFFAISFCFSGSTGSVKL